MKFFKALLTIVLVIAAIPLVDWIVKFFVSHTHRYSKDEEFTLGDD